MCGFTSCMYRPSMVCLRSCRRFSHTIVTTTITRMANSMARAATAVASPGTSGHPVSAFSLSRSPSGSACSRAIALGKAIVSPAMAALV